MKKALALILALTMSCTMLAACGDEDSSSKKDKDNSSVSESVADDASKADDASEADESKDDESKDDESKDDESKDDESKDDESKDDSSKPDLSGDITLDNETAVDTDERKFEDLMNKISNTGEFTVNADIESDGLGIKMYITSSGDSTYVEMDFLGMYITALSNKDGDYMLDTKGKKYYLDTTGSLGLSSMGEEMIGSFTALDDMKYSSTSTATINGTEYTVEKYLNTSTNIEVSYIFNAGGELVLIGNDEMYMPFEFSAKADTSKFSLDGYTAMTDAEFMEWYSANMGG